MNGWCRKIHALQAQGFEKDRGALATVMGSV